MRLASLTALLALAFAAGTPAAFAYTSPGSPTGYVNDFAEVLSTGAKQALETELSDFKKATSNEITVVTVPNMAGDYIENYAVKLFAEWGIGTKDKDNGVLLLLSIEEREMRIEVGYGLEGALPDSIAQSILDNEMTPLLKQGDYDGAVTAGVQSIEGATRGEYTGEDNVLDKARTTVQGIFFFLLLSFFPLLQILIMLLAGSRSWWLGGVIGFFGGLIGGWALNVSFFNGILIVAALTGFGFLFDYFLSTQFEKFKETKAHGAPLPWWLRGRGGGNGGGFGGFGGGFSGGGGASGRW